jgi:hypothetical protein
VGWKIYYPVSTCIAVGRSVSYIVSFRTLRYRDTSQVDMNETKHLWMGILIYKVYLSYHWQEPLQFEGFSPKKTRKYWYIPG